MKKSSYKKAVLSKRARLTPGLELKGKSVTDLLRKIEQLSRFLMDDTLEYPSYIMPDFIEDRIGRQ